MSKISCTLYPEVNGQPSRMYKDLLEKKKLGRPLANWIYASYLASNTGDAMDNAGYAKNAQGEHNAQDVYNFLHVDAMLNEMANLTTEERRLGAVDSNGQRVVFTDAKEALEKADQFNDSHSGLTSIVLKHGNVYNIVVAEKNARTHTYADDVKERLKAWDVYKQVFQRAGIDLDNVPDEIKDSINPYNKDIVQTLLNIQNEDLKHVTKKEAAIMFNLDPDSAPVERLVRSFGSIENAAQAIGDINYGSGGNYTSAQKTLLSRAVNHCKQFQGIDLKALKTQIDQTTQQVLDTSPEETIRQTLHKLNKKYKIDINEIHRVNDKIKTLSDAAAEAAVLLQRQIRQLEQVQGNNTEGKRLEGTLNQLMKELEKQKYYLGTLNFLNEATDNIKEIDDLINNVPQTGTELEKAFAMAKALQNVRDIRTQYYNLVSALSDENLIIDESISQDDIDNIRNTAKELKDYLDKKEKVLEDLRESTMINIVSSIVGDTAPDGQSIINAIKMAATDSSLLDNLYSVARASNPVVAAMGRIIRNAQDGRDEKINDIALRIRRATDKLYKSGSTSEFMYEDDGHIISDINWSLYKSARKAAIQDFYKQGKKGFDLKQAMEDWEDANTEDRVVDAKSGRTERVPDSKFRKEFPKLTQEQQEYYDTMMQIKGEIGTLLPAYAQKQYLPPQLRRSTLDALGNAKTWEDVAKAMRNKAIDLVKPREDDTNYNMNGIIDGDEYAITEGAFDNTPLRQIPIFFVNQIKDQSELLKDFSGGIQALAGTALNYEAMNEIGQVVEFIGDFVKDQAARDEDKKVDVVQNKMLMVAKDLLKWGKRNNNTTALVDGFISQHIYGQKLDSSQMGFQWSKLVLNLIGYTSFKGLAFNIKGAFANYVMGELQMLVEAGAGEFYGMKDYLWAHTKLFGSSGVGGEIAELLTNNVNHKSVLFREIFDPLQENFSDKGHTRYYNSMFRQLVSHDCSFIGYSSGEYLIHYVNMYSILNHEKVLLNGKEINLYDAFEVTNKKDGNSELKLRQGVTDKNGNAITQEYIDDIRKKIRYCNQSTHGSMNAEDKGLIHQKLWGRAILNFRQWMVEHYSRRFRARHFDASLGMDREGYWISLWKGLMNEDTKDAWKAGQKVDAIGMFMRDFYTFMFRAQSQWHNLDEMQRYNVKRVRSEMLMYIALLGLSFALGEPDEHKKDFWRRWWIYQTRRMILDTEASMPHPKAASNIITLLQSPMAGIDTLNSLLYVFIGLTNGDILDEIKSGEHKGENRYWRNVRKYALPFFKDWEQMQNMDTSDAVFQIFSDTPGRR